MKTRINVSKRAAKFLDAHSPLEVFSVLSRGDYLGEAAAFSSFKETRFVSFTQEQTKIIRSLASCHKMVLSCWLSNALHFYSDRENLLSEDWYQEALWKKLGGRREVIVEGVGRIDLLTGNKLIELKYLKGWKGALGQVLAYAYKYPNHTPCLGLIGEKTSFIEEICGHYGVEVIWLSCNQGCLEVL